MLLDRRGGEVLQASSESNMRTFACLVHGHMRRPTRLRCMSQTALATGDGRTLALPHGAAHAQTARVASLAERIIDLSADFRLTDPAQSAAANGHDHAAPGWLGHFVYGLPELRRAALRTTRYASGVGCNATATTLALWALVKAG